MGESLITGLWGWAPYLAFSDTTPGWGVSLQLHEVGSLGSLLGLCWWEGVGVWLEKSGYCLEVSVFVGYPFPGLLAREQTFLKNKFIYLLFIFGCVGSSLLCAGFL